MDELNVALNSRRDLRPDAMISAFTAGMLAFLFGLATSRLLYEALFPHALLLGQLLPVLGLSLLLTFGGLFVWRWLWRRSGDPFAVLAPFLPLLLNLAYLPQAEVDLVRSRLLYAGGLWLGTLLLYRILKGERFLALWLLVALAPIYLMTMGRTVGQADTFEFQVTIPQLGVVHPTGYPLYMLLGKLFTYLPFGSAAWRINLASVVFALLTTYMIYRIGLQLSDRPTPALLGALLYGLTPTYWSQAIEAEVYALHSLVVAVSLFLMVYLLNVTRSGSEELSNTKHLNLALIGLALSLGLGLANHLTTVFLLPPAGLTVLFIWRRWRPSVRQLGALGIAFLLPLLLYGYLPLRWAAVNQEPMGWARFLDWVVGGRFQGALQLGAWLSDSTRYRVVGRLFQAEWQPIVILLPVAIGLLGLFRRSWRTALVLLSAWLGYTFYGLNYYVPDLAVFLLPAWLVMTLWWIYGLALMAKGLSRIGGRAAPLFQGMLALLALALILAPVGKRWQTVDRSQDEGRLAWAAAALREPVAGAALLADSEKFPPLYYLQQAEGVRPDLEIMVLPDEAAYRDELITRLSEGQPVYLARFLPGLEGGYHLRSAGDLTEVSTVPMLELPSEAVAGELSIGDISLLGYAVDTESAYDPTATALTLYWRSETSMPEAHYVYTRWKGESGMGETYVGDSLPRGGQHPANNVYPTVAWKAGEIVPDHHLLPRPAVNETSEMALQVALAPPFSAPEELSWHTVALVTVSPITRPFKFNEVRAQIGTVAIDGVQMLEQVRSSVSLPWLVSGRGMGIEDIVFSLNKADTPMQSPQSQQQETAVDTTESFVYGGTVSTDMPPGRYVLYAHHPTAEASCGWLQPASAGCALSEVAISGTPLPQGAVNYDDKIALLGLDVPETELAAGGQVAITLEWQSLAPLDKDYTLFLQVLDAQDRIVGQVDSWPLQGTYPTSGWPAGEQVTDPYIVTLDMDLAPGQYRLAVGWYLLATLERLPVLDEDGAIVDDKLLVPGLTVP